MERKSRLGIIALCLLTMPALFACRNRLTSVRGFRVESYRDGVFTVLHGDLEYRVSCKDGKFLSADDSSFKTCPKMMESVGREIESQASAVNKKITGIEEIGDFLVLYDNNPSGTWVENLQIVSKKRP